MYSLCNINNVVETQSIDWQSIDYTDCMFTIKLITLASSCPQNPPSGPKIDFWYLAMKIPAGPCSVARMVAEAVPTGSNIITGLF